MPSPPPPPPSPRDLESLDLEAYLADPARKQAFVTPLFEHIAPRYDDFTRLFSFGMDARWKAALMARVGSTFDGSGTVLDVACGTGDLALAAAARFPSARVLGVDAASAMIARAQARGAAQAQARGAAHAQARGAAQTQARGAAQTQARVAAQAKARVAALDEGGVGFSTGDLTRLALGDASVDAVLAGYALRNVPRLDDGLAEVARVLRAGGQLYTLDFYRPPFRPWRALFLNYLQLSGMAVGWWWHRAPVIYGYIAPSIRHFVTSAGFRLALERAGFDVVHERRFLGGGIALHHAVRR